MLRVLKKFSRMIYANDDDFDYGLDDTGEN